MRPFKKQTKHQARKSVAFESIPNIVASQEGISGQPAQTHTRTQNWSELMDSIFLALLTEEHALGNFVNGAFTSVAWVRIISAFNARTNLNLSKDQIKNRLKVLKRTFMLYNSLANKSGWGWDFINNIPTAGDPADWEAVIADNPAYAKCRGRPFPAYKDMAFLTEKTTATGQYANTTTMHGPQTVESSSSSSPGSSEAPQFANTRGTQFSDSQTPTPEIPTVGGSASGSGSGGKRPRSPDPTNPRPKNTTTAGGRRRKSDGGLAVINEMVEIGRQRLELAREIYQSEKSSRPVIPTIQECMTRLYAMPTITPERVLFAGEALKEPNNRQFFMSMTDEIAEMWVDRQVALQNVGYRGLFPGL